ncbi:MAG: hypothetical protein ACRD4S_06515 [Candidatus Acidiferrales bacterium]
MKNQLEERTAYLRESYKAHVEATTKLVEADGGRIFGVDLVVWAVLNRSLSLLEGFTMMIEAKNILCAGSLLRLQIDSLMRLYACWLVENPHTIVEPLLKGEPLSLIKSKTGNSLTDRYLHTELSSVYPWVDSVYEATSGFIHLSKVHMVSIVNCHDVTTDKFSFGLGDSARAVKEEELLEAVDGFTEATKCLLHLSMSWLTTKEKAALGRVGAKERM